MSLFGINLLLIYESNKKYTACEVCREDHFRYGGKRLAPICSPFYTGEASNTNRNK